MSISGGTGSPADRQTQDDRPALMNLCSSLPRRRSGGPSVDQVLLSKLKFQTPFKNLHCGVVAANYKIINAGRSSWVCQSAGLQVPPEIDIYALYTKVFGSVTTTGPTTPADAQAATRRLAQRKSVLDLVAGDLQTLEGRLGPDERAKVDVHLQAVRDFENRLSDGIGNGGAGVARPATCSSVKPSKTGVPSTGQGNEANAETLFQLFMEFMGNAIGCNMVSILTFQAGRGGEHFHYDWLNLPGMRADFHDQIAHRDTGSDSVAASVTTGVSKYYAGLVTTLGQKLAAFPGANGTTALDNSLIVWANEIATGPHTVINHPTVLVGGAAGKLKKTGYFVDAGAQPHQRLGCTIENIMGVPATGFGGAPACGTLQGLSLA